MLRPDSALPESIPCVDCLGTARFLSGTWSEEEGPAQGDVATYLCPDCWERFEILLDSGADLA